MTDLEALEWIKGRKFKMRQSTQFRVKTYCDLWSAMDAQMNLMRSWAASFFDTALGALDTDIDVEKRELTVYFPDGHLYEPTATELNNLKKKGFTMLIVGSTNKDDQVERQWDLTNIKKAEEKKDAA